MNTYKAGDFTNGKMNEMFKNASVCDGITINHKQFGDFQLLSAGSLTPREVRDHNVVPLLFSLLGNYHFKYENFYAHCAIFEEEEEISTINIVSYISNCINPSNCDYFPYSALDRLRCTYDDVDSGVLNEIYHSFIDDMVEELAQFCEKDNNLDLIDLAETAIFKPRIEKLLIPLFNSNGKTIDDLCSILVACYTTLSNIFPFIKLDANGYSLTFNFKYQNKDDEETKGFLKDFLSYDSDYTSFINNRIKNEVIKKFEDYALKPEDLVKIKLDRIK